MDYRNIGSSDLQVSVVGLGCNNFGMRIGQDGANAVVDKAIELGVNFFDTAEMYAGEHGPSEEILGKALGDRRGDVIIATKFGMPTAMTPTGIQSPGSGTREYITNAVTNSLQRLGTDYIDLYMVHFPDPDTPAAETAGVLDDLVKEGKIRHAGISNVNGDQIREAKQVTESNGLAPYISVENEWSLVDRNIEADAAPAAVECGYGIFPYFPLAGGFLTGKYKQGEAMPEGGRLTEGALAGLAGKYINDHNWGILHAAEAYAADQGHSVLDLAIAWLLAQKGVPSVISGATRPDQLESNVAAGGWSLTGDDVAAINAFAS
ncbi:MAG: aldo/keto reductase [Dehalococcoidia bacterium]|nr:aldo/keto reductase [Dehalococcoidia bacterium]